MIKNRVTSLKGILEAARKDNLTDAQAMKAVLKGIRPHAYQLFEAHPFYCFLVNETPESLERSIKSALESLENPRRSIRVDRRSIEPSEHSIKENTEDSDMHKMFAKI